MAITPSDKALDDLGNLLLSQDNPRNPFIREGEDIFLRYDEICIEQKPNHTTEIRFRWQGTTTYTRSVECGLASGNTLTLQGMTGRTKVKIHCA
jgi:hypothetical protein